MDISSVFVDFNALRLVPVARATSFNIEPRGTPEAVVDVKVTGKVNVKILIAKLLIIADPLNRDLPVRLNKYGAVYQVEFTPNTVGKHQVNTVIFHSAPTVIYNGVFSIHSLWSINRSDFFCFLLWRLSL